MSGRNGQISRFMHLLDELRGARLGRSVRELLEALRERGFDVKERTVYRDLEGLLASGFPIEQTKSSQGSRYRLDPGTKDTPLRLTPATLLGLFVARGLLGPLEGSPLAEPIAELFREIESKASAAHRAALKSLAAEVEFQDGARWNLGSHPEIVDTLRSACAERQVLAVVYQSAGGGHPKAKRLGPHRLYFVRGTLYLIAEDLADGRIKPYAVARFKSATMTEAAFEKPAVDVEALWRDSFGIYRGDRPEAVALVITATLASYIREQQWHHSQKITELDDGGIRLDLTVALTPDFIRWVLGLGDQAQVVQPPALVTAVQEEASRLLRRYQAKAS